MLAPDPADAISQLTAIFNSTTGITQWVGTLVNAVLPPMNPQPSWYQLISTTLQTSQRHAQTWLNETEPDIVAGMSNAFINYSGAFANVVTDATPVIQKVSQQGGTPTAEQVKELVGLFTALQQAAAENQKTVQTLMGEMGDYQTQMEADFLALKTALAAALPAEAKARALVQQIQTQIQSAEITLAADSATATSDDIDVNNAMTSLAVGLTFAMTFDPVGFAIALLGIGVDIVISAEAEAQVQSDIQQIQALAAQLGPDEIQLGLLQGIVSNLDSLSDSVETAMTTFDDFDDTWSFANYGLTYLLVVLAQPQIDSNKIPDLNDLPAASAAWQQMSDFASKVLTMQVTPQSPVTISAQSNTRAAPQ